MIVNSFEDVKLNWRGKLYIIPARKALGAIARIEQVITLKELTGYAQRGTAPMAMLAQAYGTVLRYSGATVEDEEVYEALFSADDTSAEINEAIATLMLMMIPPKVRARMKLGQTIPEEPLAKGEETTKGNSQATVGKPSASTLRSRSLKNGARRVSSGV
jgi:hypothetical protein